ncbi:hypothetical protein V9T40_007787 [Parthenolecanium corni]|uniref:Uncharacterized protein n=1 Tax=Parthenolecanium corni TaxID=536013 RepID=A0AAN9Y5A7_9HEMI
MPQSRAERMVAIQRKVIAELKHDWRSVIEEIQDHPKVAEAFDNLMLEATRYEAFYLTEMEENETIKSRERDLLVKLNKMEGILFMKPSVKQLESVVCPSWLSRGPYSTKTKWTVAMEFQLTEEAKILRNRLSASSVQPVNLGQIVVKVYEKFPELVWLDNPIPSSFNFLEDNLNEILEEAGIFDQDGKVIIEKMLHPISEDELKNVPPNQTTAFVMYVGNLNKNGIVEIVERIKQYCTELQNQVKQTYFPTDDEGKFTSEVFILLDSNLSVTQLDGLKDLLGKLDTKDVETEASVSIRHVLV